MGKKNRFIATRKGFGSDRADEIDRRMKTRDWNRRFAVAGRLTMKSSHRKRTNCRHNNYSTVPGPAATSSSARGLRIDRGLCY